MSNQIIKKKSFPKTLKKSGKMSITLKMTTLNKYFSEIPSPWDCHKKKCKNKRKNHCH